MPNTQLDEIHSGEGYHISSPEIKSLFYSGVPIWLSALAMLIFSQQVAQSLISFFIVFGFFLSLIITVNRRWIFKSLVMPRKLESQLLQECRASFEMKVRESGKVVPDIDMATSKISNRIHAYFDETFRQIEIEYRNGRYPNIEYNWNLFITTIMTCVGLILIMTFYSLSYFEVSAGLNSSNQFLLSLGMLIIIFILAFVVYLIRISYYELKYSFINCFPLLLTTPQFQGIADISDTIQNIEASDHPILSPVGELSTLPESRSKGIDQRKAIIEGIAQQSSLDKDLVDTYLSYLLRAILEIILYPIIVTAYFIVMESFNRISAIIKISIGLSILSMGMIYLNTVVMGISLFLIGSGIGSIIQSSWYYRRRKMIRQLYNKSSL